MFLLRKTFSPLLLFAGILFALIAAPSANAQVNYSGNTSTGDTFLRPHSGFPPTELFGDATNYHTFTFTPTTAGGYRFFSQSTDGHDPVLVLYRGSFDPDNPMNNALICNDDSLSGNFFQSSFVYVLEANQPYIVVTTGYSSLDSGTFDNSITPASVSSVDGDTMGAQVWNRPIIPSPPGPPTTLFSGANAVPYQAVLVRVSQTGHYAFHLGQPGLNWDSYIILYEGSLNPAQPLVNAKTGNDDLNDSKQSKFEFDLTANVNYFVVVTGFLNSDFGEYHLQVSGPAGSIISASPPRTISGTVSRANCPNLAFDVEVLLRPSDHSGDITRTVSVAANGTFSIPNLPAKNYQIKIKSINTLSRVVSANATNGNVSGLAVPALLGGDADSINSYNLVDVVDLSRFIQAFDADPSSPNWNPLTDFNCDDLVDLLDLSILIQNFDREGEEI